MFSTRVWPHHILLLTSRTVLSPASPLLSLLRRGHAHGLCRHNPCHQWSLTGDASTTCCGGNGGSRWCCRHFRPASSSFRSFTQQRVRRSEHRSLRPLCLGQREARCPAHGPGCAERTPSPQPAAARHGPCAVGAIYLVWLVAHLVLRIRVEERKHLPSVSWVSDSVCSGRSRLTQPELTHYPHGEWGGMRGAGHAEERFAPQSELGARLTDAAVLNVRPPVSESPTAAERPED